MVRFPAEAVYVLFYGTCRPGLGLAQPSIHLTPATLSPEIQQAGSKSDQRPPPLTPGLGGIRKDIPPFKVWLHGVVLIKHRRKLGTFHLRK